MDNALKNLFAVTDLRNRVLFTLALLGVFRVEYAVVNLDTLAERFDEGTTITPELLRERGLAPGKGLIKVLARGDISKKLTVQAHKFSGKAAEKIAAAGGAAEVL